MRVNDLKKSAGQTSRVTVHCVQYLKCHVYTNTDGNNNFYIPCLENKRL